MTAEHWLQAALVPIPHDHVHAVGLVAITSAEMEGTLATVTGALIGSSSPGYMLALGQSFETNKRVCLGLADAGATTPELAAELRDILARGSALYVRRNQAMHGWWDAYNSGNEVSGPEHEAIRVRRWGRRDAGTWTAQELRDLARDLQRSSAELSNLSHRWD